jgi:hypothetical protein
MIFGAGMPSSTLLGPAAARLGSAKPRTHFSDAFV